MCLSSCSGLVSLPRGAMGWYMISNCGIPWSYSFVNGLPRYLDLHCLSKSHKKNGRLKKGKVNELHPLFRVDVIIQWLYSFLFPSELLLENINIG